MYYENKSDWTLGKNKPNSNPIKPNCLKAKMDVTLYVTKDYRKNDIFAVPENKPKANPIQTQTKPVLSAVEKFLSLCTASVTIIRKSVIRQFKRGRLGMFKFRLRLSMLVSMLALETRSSCVQLPVSIPASIPTNKLLELVRSKFGDKLACQRNSLRKR